MSKENIPPQKQSIDKAQKLLVAQVKKIGKSKKQIATWLGVVLVLIVIAVVQWFIFRDAYKQTVLGDGGTYSEGVLGPIETINPIFAKTSGEKSLSKLLFNSLYTYDQTGKLKGDLAESVSVNDKQTEYTVKLKNHLKWSDNTPLTADDVVFTVNLLKNPDIKSELSGWQLFSAQATDQSTIVFKLPSAYSPFMHSLTFPVLPKHTLKDIKPSSLREFNFSEKPVTSGPFQLRSIHGSIKTGKQVINLIKNPQYFKGAPKIDRVQLNVYAKTSDIVKALQMNEIMATAEVVYGSLPSEVKKNYQNTPIAINNGVYALFNNKTEPLKDKNIRQALAISVDRQAIRQGLMMSTDDLEGPILNEQIQGGVAKFPAQNIDEAKKLLDKSGWKIKDGIRQKTTQKDDKSKPITEELKLNIVAIKNSDFEKVAENLSKTWLEELNIKTEIKIIDPADTTQNILQSTLQPRNFDVLIYELSLGGDADGYVYWHSTQARDSGLNFANYSNTIVDDALSSGRAKIDAKYRADRYKTMIKWWLHDFPAIPLYRPQVDYISLPSINTVAKSNSTDKQRRVVFAEYRFYDVINWQVKKTTVYKTP